jgi:tetratricopeptide (TPR) repeat protein
LLEGQHYREALQVYEQNADRLLRHEPGKLIEALRAISGQVQENPQALETILGLYQKAGENAQVTEIYELLAHAYVQAGELDKAREYYLKLMQLEPANAMHAQNYQQVVEKQSAPEAPHLITAEDAAALVDELEATAAFLEQRYDDDVALAVRAALTDAELFISYNMPAKALEPLLLALPRAPRDLRINQKLAALHTRAGRFQEAAACCRTLESVYRDAGHAEEATRYGNLAAKYEERTASGAEIPAVTAGTPAVPTSPTANEFAIAAPGPGINADAEPEMAGERHPARQNGPSGLFFHAPAPSTSETTPGSPETAEFSVAPRESHTAEPDLSNQWEQELTVEAPAAPESPATAIVEAVPHEAATEPVTSAPGSRLSESMEEVRFYLGQGMVDQAEALLTKLETFSPDSPELAILRLGVDSAKQSLGVKSGEEITIEEPETSPTEPVHDAVNEPEVAHPVAPEAVIPGAPAHAVAVEPEPAKAQKVASTPQPWPQAPPPPPEAQGTVLQEFVSDPDPSQGNEFLGQTPEPAPIESEPEIASAAAPAFRSGTLDDFVSDLEASLGNDFFPDSTADPARSAPVRAEAPRARAAVAGAVPGVSAPPVMPAPLAVPPRAVPPQAAIGNRAPANAALAGAGVDLADMFGELKQELEGEVAAADEDPETHYNLGVAFREMGLLDEAIGEFQKVCQAADHGRAFPQIMQTYTWLAQCFLDKGVPQAAIRWYEKALTLPSLDRETRTALHYELASAFEGAGNKAAALNNFLEVYGDNIDYRDVAERIKALRP